MAGTASTATSAPAAKRSQVEVHEGDRLDALRYSLQANAKHGRRRDDGTLKRAYELAVKHKLVEETDVDGVQAVLAASHDRLS